ncbi:LCP family protein [Agrococcus sp. SGAir0287]|uniref:LCP family protein n=1 Tax=Agrococcus sp. SGAir0287 TaxID=2070347 RepID=UPI0010F9634B|nr:LCP family protein [Agrococcus sp. SGAir0287]
MRRSPPTRECLIRKPSQPYEIRHRSTYVDPEAAASEAVADGVPRVRASRTARHRRRAMYRRRRILALVGGSLAVALVAVVAFVATTSVRVLDTIGDNAVARPGVEPEEVEAPRWDGPVDLLIMGSDTRDGQETGDYGEAAGARSDVTMLLHVAADRSSATLVSIPRDTMLPSPECTTEDGRTIPAQSMVQVNGLLEHGPYCSLDAIRDFTGLDLQHFLVVGFDGVIGITEAVGGVEVCVSHDVADPYSGLYLDAGTHRLQGHDALAFLRTRHGFGDGSDLGRIQAQQAFLGSLARSVKDAGTLTNPVALSSLADAAAQAVTVDQAIADPGSLIALAGTLADIDLDRLVMVQLPVAPWAPDPNRVAPLADESAALFAALRDDRPVTIASESPEEPADEATSTTAPEPETSAPATSEAPGLELDDTAVAQSADVVHCAG